AAGDRPGRHRAGSEEHHRSSCRQGGRAAVLRRVGPHERWRRHLGAAARDPLRSGAAQQVLVEAAEYQARGLAVVPQGGCRPLEVRFDLREPAFYLENNPFWRDIMTRPHAERCRLFATPAFRDELAAQRGFVAGLTRSWEQLYCRLPASPSTARWQDRSVAEIATARGTRPLDAFLDVVLEDDLATQWGVVLLNGDEQAVAELIRHPAGLLALSDAG